MLKEINYFCSIPGFKFVSVDCLQSLAILNFPFHDKDDGKNAQEENIVPDGLVVIRKGKAVSIRTMTF
ncbi:hypothetical protein QQ045_028417 [Rhodiola kirilowii]